MSVRFVYALQPLVYVRSGHFLVHEHPERLLVEARDAIADVYRSRVDAVTYNKRVLSQAGVVLKRLDRVIGSGRPSRRVL